MSNQLSEIIELSKVEDFKTNISINQALEAKRIINVAPKSTENLFQILCAMNLLNAALKDKKFKSVIHMVSLNRKLPGF